jgi:hypothetical protein
VTQGFGGQPSAPVLSRDGKQGALRRLVPHQFFPENRHPFSQMMLCAARRDGCKFQPFFRNPAAGPERDDKANGDSSDHGESPDHANQQDKILDRRMRDTVSFDAYAHEHGKLK